jgi:RNA recognition motif-containing protein
MSTASRVLFVGNLSYFCEEQHLFELFSEYGRVEAVRIVQNVEKTKSLMYGFVTMSSHAEACQIVDLMDGHLFMGRKIK